MTHASCDCGWSGTYRTQPVADHATRRHSCARTTVLAQRAARVAARKAADGPRRGCEHKYADHQHGTRAAYVLDKCRCRACRDATAASARAKARAEAYGTWQPYVDAQPVRDHIAALRAQGLGVKRIAHLAGLGHGTISAVVYGKYVDGQRRTPSLRVRPNTAQRILAVTADLDTLGTKVAVDSTGTRRRIEAMLAAGWSVNAFARAAEVDDQALRSALLHQPIAAANARAVRNAYEQLWATKPAEGTWHQKAAATRARNTAKARGYVPALMWDDEDIDDPYAELAQPDWDTPTKPGKAARVHLDDVDFLLRAGESLEHVAERLGVTVDAIDKARERAA